MWARLPREYRAPCSALEARVKDKRLLEPMVRWDWGGPNVLLSGPTGVGKGAAAAFLVGRLLRRFNVGWRTIMGIHWVLCGDLCRAWRENGYGHGTSELVRKARKCRLLILDDVGHEDSAFVKTELFSLLDARKVALLPTITTTALTVAQLKEFPFSDQFLRRMIQLRGVNGPVVEVRRNCAAT